MRQFSRLLILSLSGAGVGSCTTLPHFPAGAGVDRTAALERDGKWWAHLGDAVYHAPPSSSGLSGEVGDYYYAFGSEDALSSELRERRVGGQGRLHLFHLPEGPAMLQVDAMNGNRRNALSALKQLQEGVKIPHTFPPYHKSEGYKNPLDAQGQQLEKTAVSKITAGGLMADLKELTSFDTRSYRNPKASATVQSFLQKKFEELGYKVCVHSWGSGGPSKNLVAFSPGSSGSSDLVIVGAHYDDIPASGPAPGAEDNGSGVAALLGIMRAFRAAGLKTKTSVAFVAFAGEESGLLGSNAYARSILSSDSKMEQCMPRTSNLASSAPSFLHKAKGGRSSHSYKAIIMDEVGWQSPKLTGATVNLEAYDWTEEVMEHLAQSSKDHNGDSLTVVHSNHPFGSDHMSFLSRQMPAVLTINGDDEAYPFYHTKNDKIGQVTGDLVAKIAKMNMGGLLRLAGLETGPATASA